MELNDVIAGLRAVAVDERYRAAAIRNVTAWWNALRYAAFRPQLESLAGRAKWELLIDSFYRVVPFGTGGRRGPVGIGPNRINQETVVTSVQGHVNYLRRRLSGRLRVVVAFDVRVFRDLRGLYDPDVPNPLLGISSRDFARLASAVYAANDVEVVTVTGDDGFFLSTPELSFAIRYLHAHGGLNISASHNHPDDNGAKFYMPSGGQPVPPDDEHMVQEVEAVTDVPSGDFDAAVRAGQVEWWDAALHNAYIEENLSKSIDRSARRACIVYTPLHGTGRHTVGDLLPRAGFDMRFVARQLEPDGAFPGVKFRVPNPEVPESMELVTAEARDVGADAGFATDPDADRLGVTVAEDGGWRCLSGNEIAVVLAAYIIETRGERGTLPRQGFMIKTAVTTELLTRIARAHGVQMVGDLLVGFKYVGQVLDAIEKDGRCSDVRGTLDDFLLAAEESNGVLVSAQLRDKDAAGGALLLAELCARLRQHGGTLAAYLADVYRRYGYATNTGYSLVMEGITGAQLVTGIMERLRAHAPHALEGRALHRAVDYWDEATFGPMRSETDRASRNFIRLTYDGDLHVSVRPSGTEPKIKFYVEQVFDPQPAWTGDGFATARHEMDEATQQATLALVDQVLRLVDITLPRAALLVSSLVSLDNRLDFVNCFLPELQERAASATDADSLAAWVDDRLKAFGTDPRYLVKAGIAEYLHSRSLPAQQDRLLRQVFFL
ncbi:MAG TPA: phospho-sugar mutase [Candidatus Acidoferrales bacterium]|nr:phospho-sugar mutase [Candidatus Acidoferrales bacterium]